MPSPSSGGRGLRGCKQQKKTPIQKKKKTKTKTNTKKITKTPTGGGGWLRFWRTYAGDVSRGPVCAGVGCALVFFFASVDCLVALFAVVGSLVNALRVVALLSYRGVGVGCGDVACFAGFLWGLFLLFSRGYGHRVVGWFLLLIE